MVKANCWLVASSSAFAATAVDGEKAEIFKVSDINFLLPCFKPSKNVSTINQFCCYSTFLNALAALVKYKKKADILLSAPLSLASIFHPLQFIVCLSACCLRLAICIAQFRVNIMRG